MGLDEPQLEQFTRVGMRKRSDYKITQQAGPNIFGSAPRVLLLQIGEGK
jgi:hypothetical protein